jgi:SAM-dependent methyltransferase
MGGYFSGLYARTMREAYALAEDRIVTAIADGGQVLDCGAGGGHVADRLSIAADRYHGIDWSNDDTERARARGLQVVQGDLNQPLPYPDAHFRCVFGLSVLEHLLRPCRYLRECHRVLEPGGRLVILTPNIATYFTAFLVLAGRMPSSGPHPDSEALLASTGPVSNLVTTRTAFDVENDAPSHRHLVIFSYLALKRYLRMLGFRDITGHGFGVYPFPNAMQPMLERLDPYHAHQMVFVARK